jgi:hypothetical protein
LPSARGSAANTTTRSTGEERPALAVIARQGDARAAVAVAVDTEGIAADRGATAAVALAALVEARVAERGLPDATAVGGWGGWRLRTLVGSAAEARRAVDTVREAMLAPVTPGEPALEAVARKLAALARRPLTDRALVGVAQCTGEAFGTGAPEVAAVATELESWRQAADGLGRVAWATAGDAAVADAAAEGLALGPRWPQARPRVQPVAGATSGAADGVPVVYDASGELAPGAARIVVVARTETPEQAVAAAPSLGDTRGALASRLAALETPGRVRAVVATAHSDGGCVAVTIDLGCRTLEEGGSERKCGSRDLAASAAPRIATAAALATQEIAVELSDATAAADLGRALALRASDPRDAAERAAWWALAGRRSGGGDEPRIGVTVGIAAPRTGPARSQRADPNENTGPARSDALENDPPSFGADGLRAEIDRAVMAWHAPAVEGRTRVERGQGEAWVLVASTCGTLGETSSDAGSGAVVAGAAASQAAASGADARVEPFIASDGVGVLAHGPAREGESPAAHARRLADLAARAFAADPLDSARIVQARSSLLARVSDVDARALGVLGGSLSPGRPSWVQPLGTAFGLASVSDEAVALRAAELRAGPLRVAVLANVDEAQAQAATRAVDRWIVRRPGEARSCSPLPSPASPRPGTYAVDVPAGAPSEALLALALPATDDAARAAAVWIAAALDGADGMLAHTLAADPDSAVAEAWSAAVLGAPRSSALVVRIVAADTRLDRAVSLTRALFERLRQGALREEDRIRAAAAVGRAAVAAALDPRARTIDVWRGAAAVAAPSLDALQAFAAATLRDDALVVVAARPARPDSVLHTRPVPSGHAGNPGKHTPAGREGVR